jgi:hypothetical protein
MGNLIYKDFVPMGLFWFVSCFSTKLMSLWAYALT